MDEKMELMEIENTEVYDGDYEDSGSNLAAGLIGLGIGVAGTLLAKTVVKRTKNLISKAKAKKAKKDDVIDVEDFNEVESEDPEEESEE